MKKIWKTMSVEEGKGVIAQYEKDRLRRGVINLLSTCSPGTDIEITIDVPGAKQEIITYARKEK